MIENYLLRGRQNARSREMLVALTGLSDRNVRQAIEDARENGVFICTDDDGRGYYLSDDVADLKRQYMKDTARIAAISKRRKHIRKYLKERGEEV